MSLLARALTSVPPADPRPLPLAPEVVGRAVTPFAPALVAWAEKARLPMIDEPRAVFALTTAICKAGVDAFRVGCVLRENFRWPVDIALVREIEEIASRLPAALRVVVAEWVARTGLRVPAKAGDLIEYADEHDCQMAGKVYAVHSSMGYCTVIRQTDERAINVCAEQIVANVTTGLYAPQEPRPLGTRYENAPALAAEDARRKASRPAQPAPVPAPRVTSTPAPFDGPGAA